MLAFSRRQLAALEDATYCAFLRETLALHRRDCPGLIKGQTDNAALDILDECAQLARNFGFETEVLIRRFLVVQALAGRLFHQDPAFTTAHPHLEGDGTNAHTRMMRIENAVLEVLRPAPKEDDPFA